MKWLSGLIGPVADALFGNYQSNRSRASAGEVSYDENYKGFAGRLDAAKAYGIHPATALGASISGGSGGGIPASSNFTDFAARAVEDTNRNKQYQAERDFQRSQDAANRAQQSSENRRAEERHRAELEHLQKQGSFIDEQIRGSQEQRMREAARATKTMSSVAGGQNPLLAGRSGSASSYVTHVPEEVTRHRDGITDGSHPGRTHFIDGNTGERIPIPHGMNWEMPESLGALRWISEYYGVPFDKLTLKYWSKGNRNKRNTLEATKRWRDEQASMMMRKGRIYGR